MKLFLFFMGCFFQFGFSQEWEGQFAIALDENRVWNMDASKNIFISRGQVIEKYNNGKLMMQQSFKTLGNLSAIDASNTLKIALFSEEQQQICFLDNALALQNDCVSLADLGINWATAFCVSGQPDRFWVYDEVNSELDLISKDKQLSQRIQNLNGLLKITDLRKISEKNNQLFILDGKNRCIQLDQFGSLIADYSIEEGKTFAVTEEGIFWFNEREIARFKSFSSPEITNDIIFTSPEYIEDSIVDFYLISNQLVVQTEVLVNCFVYKK